MPDLLLEEVDCQASHTGLCMIEMRVVFKFEYIHVSLLNPRRNYMSQRESNIERKELNALLSKQYHKIFKQ